MCRQCEEENDLIDLLKRAQQDRSLITDDLLDQLAERIQDEQDRRLDRAWYSGCE